MNVPDEAMDQAAAKVAGSLSTDPIDTAARNVVDQQRTAVKSSLYGALLENPDVAARAQRLGRQAGLPADVVQRNLPEVQRNQYLNDIDKVLEQHPVVMEFLSRPEFAAVAHDDVDNLSALDTALRGFKRTGGAAMSGLWGLASGLTGAVRAGTEIAAPVLDPLAGTVLPENPLRRASAGLAGAQEFFAGQSQANMPKAQGNLAAGFYSGIASLSRNLATLPIALVNPPVGLSLMAGSVAGEEYGKAREQNMAPVIAASYGATQGAIEYATERLPLFKLLGDLKAGAPLGKMIAGQMATEIPGEQIATVLQDLNEWAALPENKDKPFADYLAERPDAAVQTLVATVVGVGGQVTVVKGIEALIAAAGPQDTPVGEAGARADAMRDVLDVSTRMQARMAQAELAERDAQALTQLAEIVQQGKLAQRDPTAFQEFAQRAVESSPVQDVYVNAQTFAQLAQQAGVSEQQLPEGIRDQLPEALATGGDIRIPVAEFAAQIAPTQYAQGLIDHLKTDPLGMSRAEAQVFMQTQLDEMQAEVERTMAASENNLELRTSIDTVRQRFTEQLDTAARFTPDVNQQYASLLANFYGVTASRVGMTAEQLAAMYPLQIQAEGVTGASVMMDQGAKKTTVYHGTTPEAAAAIERDGFDIAKSADGTIWFTSNPDIGEVAATGKGAVVARAFDESTLKLGGWEEADKYSTNELIQMGYDGLKLEDGGETTYQIFNPEKLERVQEFAQSPLPDTIEIDGVQRPTTNSNGQPIAQTEEGVRNFWAWFGDSKVVDDQGRPLVVYHGTRQSFDAFDPLKTGTASDAGWYGDGFYFTPDPMTASSYAANRDERSIGFEAMPDGSLDAGANAIPAYLSIKSPYDWGSENNRGLFQNDQGASLRKRAELEAAGHDGVLVYKDVIQIPEGGSLSDNQWNLLVEASPLVGRMGRDRVTELFQAREWSYREIEQSYGVDVASAMREGSTSRRILMEAVAFRDTQIKSAIGNTGAFDPANPNILNQSDVDITETDAFKAWAKTDEPVIESNEINDFDFSGTGPFVMRAFHGTTHEFDAFNASLRGNYEGQFGKVNYFTSSEQDATGNYAGAGPDLTARIEQRAERLQDEILARFEEEGRKEVLEAMYLETSILRFVSAKVADMDDTDAAYEAAKIIAKRDLAGNKEQVLEVFIRTEKPFVVGTDESPWIEFVDFDALNQQAIERVAEDNGVEVSEVEENRDDYEDQIDEARWEIESDTPNALTEAIQVVADRYDFDPSDLLASIQDDVSDGVRQSKLEELLRGSEALAYAEDPETGDLIGYHALGEIIQELGFDSIVLKEANARFKNMNMEPGTAHVHVFDSNNTNIKSVNNLGTFNPDDPNIYRQGSGNRGQIAFGDDITQVPSIITLLKGADLSTFLHESGHFFLEVQMDLAARISAKGATATPGEQALVADAQTLLDWFGVRTIDEWFAMPMEQKRSYHEQFARGFEAYAFEGKAPSIEMQTMFQRFRSWLVRIYKKLAALNVELTDDVRGVMDRMIATEEQIELAQRGRSMLPLFESAQQAGMTVDEFAAYQNQNTQATEDAIDDLQARTLRDMQWMRNARGREIKKLQRLSAERRREVRMDARRRIMADPTYQAWAFLTNKMDANDKAAVAPVEPPKSKPGRVDPTVDSMFVAIAKLGGLNRADVENTWGWDPAERSPMPIFGKYLLRREGGLPFDAMLESLVEYGYLPADQNGKGDVADFEKAFDDEYRGNPRYSLEYDYDAQVERQPGEGADLEQLGAGRLNISAVRYEIDLPEEVVAIIEKHRMTAPDGIHPDFVAEQFGFTSGNELVRRLAAAEPPQQAIEGLTDQLMFERFGELATPEAIERAADAAIHNDARARFVATELNALQRATGKPKVLAAAARDFANQMIGRLLVRNVRPGQYAAAEVRAAKAAEKAMKAGDTALAAAEKRNQLVNTYATKAAHAAIDEVEQALRYLKKFEREGTRKNIDVDYLDQIDTILERFDLRTGQSLKSIDKRKSLAAWISEQEDLGIEVELPEKLRAEAFRQSYKDLSVEEMRGLVDSIKQIEHLGRLKDRLLTVQDNRRFADIVLEMTSSIEASAGGRKVNNRTRDTLGSRAASLFKGFVASHRKVASLARELDGFKDAGPMWSYLIRTMNAAGDREVAMRAQATQDIAALLKPILAGARLGGKGQYFPQLGLSLNRGEQIVIALNAGNAGNLQRLLDGRGWTPDQVQQVLQNLSETDLQFVQQVWDYFETYRPMIAAKERRVMGKEPVWVEPQPLAVMTRDGVQVQLRGGYFPIVYDTRESGRAEQQADAEQAKQMMKGAMVAATTRRSFTKTRAEAVTGRPLMLTWDALFRGVNDVIHDLSWHEWVIDANRIIRNEQVDKAIRTGFGAETVQQFKSAIRDIATGEVADQDALSRVVAPIRKGAAVAGLGFNLLNAMIQPLGLTQSMVRIGPQWVMQGVAAWAKSPVQLVSRIYGKSTFMKNRGVTTTSRELNEIRSVVQGRSEIRRKLDALTFMPMVSMQLVADIPTWWGAYQKALADAPVDMAGEAAEDRAIALADQAVIDAQASGQIKDLAAIQRGGQLQRMFTVFYGYFSASYNLGVEKAKATNFRSPTEVMHLAWDYLLLYSAPAVLAELIYSVLQGDDDLDDPEELARKLAGAQLSYLMGTMVGLRETTMALQKATGTNEFTMNYGGPAGLRFVQELDKLGQQIGQGEVDRAMTRAAVNVGGVLLHLPSGQINRTIDGVIAVSEGKTDNPAAVLFGPPPERR